MFLRWAKNKVKNWIKKNLSTRDVVLYLIPLVLSVLRAIAQKTKNRADDAAVEALETFWTSWLAREE